MMDPMRGASIVLCAACALFSPAPAQERVESNVVYGMYSGLALLMDIYHPEEPKGVAILHVPLAGWMIPMDYNGISPKDYFPEQLQPMVEAGFTVFSINVRGSPRFRYPAPLEDAQRAVRFIRSNADRFGIDPENIGGWGFSAGAHIVGLLGTLDGDGDPDDPDSVNRVSARLQCVVAGAMPSDLSRLPSGLAAITSLLGAPPVSMGQLLEDRHTVDVARQASPLYHVSSDDAPFRLEHGDRDEVVPFEQAEWMVQALREAEVPVQLRRVQGGDHGGPAWSRQDGPERFSQIAEWFDRHLGVSR